MGKMTDCDGGVQKEKVEWEGADREVGLAPAMAGEATSAMRREVAGSPVEMTVWRRNSGRSQAQEKSAPIKTKVRRLTVDEEREGKSPALRKRREGWGTSPAE
jgi:hypothetical protein